MSKNSITPKEFRALPLSEAILWVIEDIKNFKKQKITIDMGTWWYRNGEKELCSVCAGGAAVLGFCSMEEINRMKLVNDQKLSRILKIPSSVINEIKCTFDEIRSVDYTDAFWTWYSKAPLSPRLSADLRDLSNKHDEMWAVLNHQEINTLIKQMKELSKLLKKHGY